MSFRDTQNPGIGGLDELTDSETLMVQQIAALGDPNADRILFWDDSAGSYKFLTPGTGLTITGTTIDASSSGVAWGAITGTLSNQTDLQTALNAKQATITFGTGVLTALGVNIGSAGAPVLLNGALGTPSSGTLTNCTFPTLNQNTSGSAATLTTTRTLWGQNFNGSANVTGDITLGVSSITMTGSIAATGARVTKGWFTDIESTNIPTVGGVAILTSLTAPQFTTIELGHATDTTLSRVSAGVIAVEGITIPTISSTSTITNKRNQPRITSAASYTTNTGSSLDVSTTDIFIITAQAGALLFNNPGGTPQQGEKLIIRIKDNGTARALTWDTQFRAMGTALPSTTVLSKTLYLGFFYNSTDTKWDLVASAQEA